MPRRPAAVPGQAVGRILFAHGGKTMLERELKPGRLVIGRTADNDLQIDSKFISRHHCQIVTQRDSLPHRGSQQHQRHLREVEARAAA